MNMDERRIRSARLLNSQRRGDWYKILNKSDSDATELWIYDEIGPWWGVTAKDFVTDLQAIKTPRITLHLHTPGGEVFDGIAIYNALREHPAKIEARVDAMAASIGSVIAMAADKIVMAKHSEMMIHDPIGLTFGNAADHRETIDILDRLGNKIAGIYQERAGGSVKQWRERMLAATFYEDQEAVDAGLADEIGPAATRAKDEFDLTVFTGLAAPRNHRDHGEPTEPTIRDAEMALRDAGLSRAEAKAILAKGWDARDATPQTPPGDPRSSPYRMRLEADLLELALA